MWNQTSRSFGQAFIGDRTSMQAAEDLLAFVQSSSAPRASGGNGIMRRVVGGLLVAAALTMAAGQTRAQVQLTFRYAQDNPEQVQAGIVEFERRNPEIKVAFEQSSGSTPTPSTRPRPGS